MEKRSAKSPGRLTRVQKNLRHGLSLAWAASPRLLTRYTLLGMFSAVMPPVSVWLGSLLVDKIAEVQTGMADKPVEDIVIEKITVSE